MEPRDDQQAAWGEGLPTGPAKPAPRWLKVAWPIWRAAWALFWITVAG
jgi:hypothetical protein